MGQQPSSNNNFEISSKYYQFAVSLNKSAFDSLSKNLSEVQCYPIGDNQLRLTIPGTKQMLIFITNEKITNPKQYSGHGSVYNKENLKIFQGAFQNGTRNGYGIEYDLESKITYKGEFMNGLYHGWGITSYGYEGEFKLGKKEGYGCLKNKGEEEIFLYEGYWKKDKMHGIGCLNTKASEIVSLLASKDLGKSFREQAFNIQERSKAKYIGQWMNGQRTGVGKLIKQDQIYEGEFSNGQYEGHGTLYKKDEKVLQGIFQRGEFIKTKYRNTK